MSSSMLSLLAATLFATQTTLTQPSVPRKNTGAVITVSGCLSQDTATAGSLLFSDASTGAKDRPGGVDRRRDPGQRGEFVLGSGSRSLTIRGGLVPSPNVAAQASALDPVRSAIARTSGGSSRMASTPVPDFRAWRVQPIGGSCP
jgi:hypothetical protein